MSSEVPKESAPVRRKFVFLVWVIAASLVLLEASLRIATGLVAPEPLPTGQEPDFGAYRVLAVGDSWVAGAEAPEGQGFVDHLERDLPSHLSPESRVQLTNLGRTGANSAYVALTVNDTISQLLPDLLVVLVGQNNATNFYRVAEVEELLGNRRTTRVWDGLRVVKLLRIAVANVQGSSGYRSGVPTSLPEVAPMLRDDQDNPLNQLLVFGSEAGRNYLARKLEDLPSDGMDPAERLAWRVLYGAATRDLVNARTAAEELRRALDMADNGVSGGVGKAKSARDLLARYALLRLARQERDWRAMRHHAGAFVDYEPRSLVTDLGAAEAHLLSGDWRSARAYLESAHNRAPGFLDTIDLASRIPLQARNPAVYEALEFRPLGIPLAYELVPVLRQVNQNDAATEALRGWVDAVPLDTPVRTDLAVWLVDNGMRDQADALMGVVADEHGHIPQPADEDPELWRYLVTRAKATGEREHTEEVVSNALGLPHLNAGLLEAATRSLSAHALCNTLPKVADQWFSLRGDGNGYVRLLAPCMDSGAAAARLDGLRSSWRPLGDKATWRALVKAGHQPFDLLYRDLDFVVDRAEEMGATVVLVNYPNPSEDHTALREILTDYAAGRAVEYVDTYGQFAKRFQGDSARWEAHIAPNGHANAAGYRLMADDILSHLKKRDLLKHESKKH